WCLPAMAPLAHALALLAMAVVATAAIKELSLDMAKNSFDDQYLHCSTEMTKNLRKLQSDDFDKNGEFKVGWGNATKECDNRRLVSYSLTKDETVALMAYTMKSTGLYEKFNKATREAGESPKKYKNEFPFKSLHFLLTRALQKLNPGRTCWNVYRGVRDIKFNTEPGKEIRFGQFASSSLSEKVAQGFGQGTVFKVYTCHGVDIQKFSYDQREKEVLIPPFETFRVTDVRNQGKEIHLQSTRNFSNYDCGSLKGDIMGT
ncbi:NRT2 ribosyltransferase, partial [Hippolais icterina]|nr:NRT2 ribosyltransferase [Hippolais icterina]